MTMQNCRISLQETCTNLPCLLLGYGYVMILPISPLNTPLFDPQPIADTLQLIITNNGQIVIHHRPIAMLPNLHQYDQH